MWPRQEGSRRISPRREATPEEFLCHGTQKAGAQGTLLGRFWSGSGLSDGWPASRSLGLMLDSTSLVRLTSDSGAGGA